MSRDRKPLLDLLVVERDGKFWLRVYNEYGHFYSLTPFTDAQEEWVIRSTSAERALEKTR